MSGLPERPQSSYLPRDSDLEEAKPMKRDSSSRRRERDDSPVGHERRRGRSRSRARSYDSEDEDEGRRDSRHSRRKRRRSHSPEVERRHRKHGRSSRDRSPSSDEDDYRSSSRHRHHRSERERGRKRERERTLSRHYSTRSTPSVSHRDRRNDDRHRRRSPTRRRRSASPRRAGSLYSIDRHSPFLDSSRTYSYKINIPTSRVVSFLIGHGGQRTRDIVHRAGLFSLVFHNGRPNDSDRIPFGDLVGSCRAIKEALRLIAGHISEHPDKTFRSEAGNLRRWCVWDSERLTRAPERRTEERSYEHEHDYPSEEYPNEDYRNEDYRNEDYRTEDYRDEDYREQETVGYSPAPSTNPGIGKTPHGSSPDPSPPPTPTPTEVIPSGPRSWVNAQNTLQEERQLPSSTPSGPKNPHSRPPLPIRSVTPNQKPIIDKRSHYEREAFPETEDEMMIDVILPIPNLKYVLGRIIGANGHTIKQLSRTTGSSCFLTFHEGEPVFRVCGPVRRVKLAIDIVDDHIAGVIPSWPNRETRKRMGYDLLGIQMPPGPYAEQAKPADFSNFAPTPSQKEEKGFENQPQASFIAARSSSTGLATSSVPPPLQPVQTGCESGNVPIEVNLPIPNLPAVLGRVIGSGGSIIKQLMRSTGTHCFVDFSSGEPFFQVNGLTSGVVMAIDTVDRQIVGVVPNWPNREERKRMGYDLLGPQMPPERFVNQRNQSGANNLPLPTRSEAVSTQNEEYPPPQTEEEITTNAIPAQSTKPTSPLRKQAKSPDRDESRHSTLEFASYHSSPRLRTRSRSPSALQHSLSDSPFIPPKHSPVALRPDHAPSRNEEESPPDATDSTPVTPESGAEGPKQAEVTEEKAARESEEMLDYSEDQPIDYSMREKGEASSDPGKGENEGEKKDVGTVLESEHQQLSVVDLKSVAAFFFDSTDETEVKNSILKSLFSNGKVFAGYPTNHPDSESFIAEKNERR